MLQLPLSLIAHQHLHQLAASLDDIKEANQNDSWRFIWGSTTYNTKKIYNYLMGTGTAPKPTQWIWKSCCMPRHKFFCWLMLQDRINMCDLLTRKQFQLDNTICTLCQDQPMEDRMHLFFNCPFSQGF